MLRCCCGQCNVSMLTNCSTSSHKIHIPCGSVSERTAFYLLHKQSCRHICLITSKVPDSNGSCQFKTMAQFRAEAFGCRLQHIWVWYPAKHSPVPVSASSASSLYIIARYRARLCARASAWLVITARLAGSPHTILTPQPSKLTSCCNFLLFSPLSSGILLVLEIEK